MLLVFVHGWSVTHTKTYGDLPEVLAAKAEEHGLALEVRHVFLGQYISFHDEVTMDDLAEGLDRALRRDIPNNRNCRRVFSCITHSTGGPVVRQWIENYYGASDLRDLPLRHLVMLAPANHGSALAQLGKSRVGRLKASFQGVEPGQGILDWLELGSTGSLSLNRKWLGYRCVENRLYPFVLSGETIDRRLYDYLNSYTGEPGSDGVVRLSAANLNFRVADLSQKLNRFEEGSSTILEIGGEGVRSPQALAFGVIPGASHSGRRMGIMRSVRIDDRDTKPVVDEILSCLRVNSTKQYEARRLELLDLTRSSQSKPGPTDTAAKDRYVQVVFGITDDSGAAVNDYDLLILAGIFENGRWLYSPDRLPTGFFEDKQRNRLHHDRLTFYLSYERMMKLEDAAPTASEARIGFRLTARPDQGFARYVPAEFRSFEAGVPLRDLLRPNETTVVNIELKRVVDDNVFRLGPATEKRRSFQRLRPSGDLTV